MPARSGADSVSLTVMVTGHRPDGRVVGRRADRDRDVIAGPQAAVLARALEEVMARVLGRHRIQVLVEGEDEQGRLLVEAEARQPHDRRGRPRPFRWFSATTRYEASRGSRLISNPS